MQEKVLVQSIRNSVEKLELWLLKNEWKGYDPFEGLNSWLRPFTLEIPFLRQSLVQFIKRFPVNIRPLVGIKPTRSTKGIAYIVKGDLKRYSITKDKKFLDRAEFFLNWLIEKSCPGYSGYCWGNHFDYQTRGYFLKKNNPTLVWTALTGRAFADAYFITGKKLYAEVVDSSCRFITKDLPRIKSGEGECISYVSNPVNLVHNANLLGAGLLAAGYAVTGRHEYKDIAEKALIYSIDSQLDNGAWYYGEELKYHWIDNWHTAYNLDAIKLYQDYSGDSRFIESLNKGFNFYVNNFFTESGIPKFYFNIVYPVDIQSCSQSIDTLINFRYIRPENIELASKVAIWTIKNMQDGEGYFYHYKNGIFTNKTPTFHWGQATMYHALHNLLSILR